MPLPQNPSASVRRLNPHLFEQPTKLVAGVVMPDTEKKRIRQKAGPKMNKTEAAFFEHLQATLTNHRHYAQSITFSIANGCRYTPDVVSISDLTGMLIASEVKGFARDDAIVKIKCFASLYPKIRVQLVTRRGSGGWAVEPVLP